VTPGDVSDLLTLCRDSVGSAAAAALATAPAAAGRRARVSALVSVHRGAEQLATTHSAAI
jgi:hypothetical protein